MENNELKPCCKCGCEAELISSTELAFKNGYEKGRADAAAEIFEEIISDIDKAIDFTADSRRIRFERCQQRDIDPYKDRFFNVFDGKYNCLLGIGKYIAELKKKYAGEKRKICD